MRHQNQNNQDDQRSSIGYIGGNIGYMSSLGQMEYPYEQNSHFQLWKPFFPRGEAPPPYEEAISMAQSESLSAQAGSCTVSVATSTHRTLPMNICNNATTENTDLSSIPPNNINNNINNNNNMNNNTNNSNNNNNPITSNTTNLINININNAGNITAVATGENHLIQSNGNYLSATPNNTLPRHSTANNQLIEQDLVNRNLTYNSAINSCSNSELALSNSSIRDIPCTLQNCDLNTSCSLIRSSSSLSSNGVGIVGGSGCYSAPSTMKMNQQNQTSNQSLAQILATNQSTQNLYEQYIDCMSTGGVSQTILPPPLFDTNCTPGNFNQCYEIQSHPGNYCTLSAIEMPKISSSSKRLHRTIPKHFTMSSSSAIFSNEINSQQQQQQQQQHANVRNVENKKSSCQCPVQHVPMTYMQFPSTHPQQQQQQQQPIQEIQQQVQQHFPPPQRHQHSTIYMSGSKKHNVIKSTTFPSAMSGSSSVGKIQTIANSELLGITSVDVVQPITTSEISGTIISSGGSGTLRRSHRSSGSTSSSNNSTIPTTPNKKSIATISVANSSQSSTAVTTPGYFTPKVEVKHHPTPPAHQQQQQIHSILKNKNHSGVHVNVINVSSDVCLEQNPILPPKLYKTSNSSSKYTTPSSSGPSTPNSSKQIHTITRPNELTSSSSQFSLLSINGSSQNYQQQSPQQYQHQQPTQLRTNIQGTLYNTKTLPRGTHGCEGEKIRQHREQLQQSTSNYSINTLPKNHHQQQSTSQQIYAKVANTSRSVLNDVVNKVPSVIMLPIPQQQNGSQTMKSVTMTNSNSLTKMSSSSSSSSSSKQKNHLNNENHEMEATSTNVGCHSQNSTLKRSKLKRETLNVNEKVISSKGSTSTQMGNSHEKSRCESVLGKCIEKPLPILTTSTNCTNPKEHFLPSETSLDDDYLSECENCKTAGTGSRYYLDDEGLDELPLQETMTLQRKLMNENDENDQQNYYRVSSTLPSNTNKKIPVVKTREPWFSTIPASSSSDEETLAE
ncbi:CLUMA_CG006498, isoform A [Clunio marinus]|uniref:CLUMA_CG006498, isoform A n=1 Tax=Clunio marinus TaxID=568069 RepID=A0A1J1HXY2_9DIPT|nr:CLUMA_CG006498, isoform A [Clunio marinus]